MITIVGIDIYIYKYRKNSYFFDIIDNQRNLRKKFRLKLKNDIEGLR